MRLSSLSVFSALRAAVLFVQSDCSAKYDGVLGEAARYQTMQQALEYVPVHLGAPNTLRDLLMSRLTRDIAQGYIADANVRAEYDALLVNPRNQICLNLGEDFKEYIVNPEFRAKVDNLVDNPLKQVWSDADVLDLSFTQMDDMNPLAGFTQVNAALLFPRAQVILHLGGDIAKNYIANLPTVRDNINALLANPREQITLSLPADMTRHYIANFRNIRESINALLANPPKQIRLNLGEDFRKYMFNPEFRAKVDNLVDNPLEQVWSDVEELDLAYFKIFDISPLARLKNLKELNLSFTQVTDITPLAGLTKLKKLDLSRTQVTDISPLTGIDTLETLYLYGTPVINIRSLDHLRGLRIYRS